jgi:putative endonuclease
VSDATSKPPGSDRRPSLGRLAEAIGAEHLARAGLRVVARNWRHREGREGGEIDIVADDAGTCVFVEVRSRTGDDRGHPLEMVGGRKRSRVIRAARYYLDVERPSAAAYRFDVVAVTFWPVGRPPDVVHVPDAFGTT